MQGFPQWSVVRLTLLSLAHPNICHIYSIRASSTPTLSSSSPAGSAPTLPDAGSGAGEGGTAAAPAPAHNNSGAAAFEASCSAPAADAPLSQQMQIKMLLQHALQPDSGAALPPTLEELRLKVDAAASAGGALHKLAGVLARTSLAAQQPQQLTQGAQAVAGRMEGTGPASSSSIGMTAAVMGAAANSRGSSIHGNQADGAAGFTGWGGSVGDVGMLLPAVTHALSQLHAGIERVAQLEVQLQQRCATLDTLCGRYASQLQAMEALVMRMQGNMGERGT
eukprot:CAMPEP_0202910546 /NCGR_PEP_ID=MMETSP1392-20130828/52310_1 /ASSEMBLY_ACC=CAM_ASM_000868 /TAXON_ID=225041 /ORGANISM="Chlamydomonas chlamydogama, Strain SAG 11-48b" /LENGTH=278 /DNA_ID=CAMNT_0049600685 /DNA_START=1 /DNA_END=837 /DNA_ORIENTATION=+